MSSDSEVFITKVAQLPAMSSALMTLSSLYNKTKNSNGLFTCTFGAAEAGVKSVTATAQPLLHKYEGPLMKANSYACDKLDNLTTTYPILTKQTDEIMNEGKDLAISVVQPALDKVNAVRDAGLGVYNKGLDTVTGITQYSKDTVTGITQYSKDTVTGITQYSKDTVTGITQYSKDTVAGISNYGVNTVNSFTNYTRGQIKSSLHRAMKSPLGQQMTDQMVNALTLSETYMDKYLPPVEGSVDDKDPANEEIVNRVLALKVKMQRRLTHKALERFAETMAAGQEILTKLGLTVNALEFVRQKYEEMKTKGENVSVQIGESVAQTQKQLMDIWQIVTSDNHDLEPCQWDQLTTEQKYGEMARVLVCQFRLTVSSVGSTISHLPTTAKDSYDRLYNYTEDLASSLTDKDSSALSDWMITHAKETLSNVQVTLTSLMEGVSSSLSMHWIVNKRPTPDVSGEDSEFTSL